MENEFIEKAAPAIVVGDDGELVGFEGEK